MNNLLIGLKAALQEKKDGIINARKHIRERILAKEAEIDKIALERAQRVLDYTVSLYFLFSKFRAK